MSEYVDEIFKKYRKVGFFREDDMRTYLLRWFEQRIKQQLVESVDRFDKTDRIEIMGTFEEIAGWQKNKIITISLCVSEGGTKRYDYIINLLKDRIIGEKVATVVKEKKPKVEEKPIAEEPIAEEPIAEEPEEEIPVTEENYKEYLPPHDKDYKEWAPEEKAANKIRLEKEKVEVYEDYEKFAEEKTLENVVKDLEAYEHDFVERDPEVKEFFRTGSYSIRNYLMVLSQAKKRKDEKFVGVVNSYSNWMRLGVRVNKRPDPEKPYGFRILMPKYKKGKASLAGGKEGLVGFKLGTVFDISQTNKYEQYMAEHAETEGKVMEKVELEYNDAAKYVDDNYPDFYSDVDTAYELIHGLAEEINKNILHLTDELEEDSTKKAILDELCCYLVMKKIGIDNQFNIRYDYGYSNYWGYHVLDDFSWTEFGKSYNAMMNHISPPPPPEEEKTD